MKEIHVLFIWMLLMSIAAGVLSQFNCNNPIFVLPLVVLVIGWLIKAVAYLCTTINNS